MGGVSPLGGPPGTQGAEAHARPPARPRAPFAVLFHPENHPRRDDRGLSRALSERCPRVHRDRAPYPSRYRVFLQERTEILRARARGGDRRIIADAGGLAA